MALYVPAGARRRRLILAVVGGLVVGLLVGVVAGRATSPGLADEVADVQELALDAATALQRIPIEYEQSIAGEGGETATTIVDAIDRAHGQLDDAYAEAIWLADDAPEATDAAFDDLAAMVADGATAAEFEAAVTALVDQIDSTFGLESQPSG